MGKTSARSVDGGIFGVRAMWPSEREIGRRIREYDENERGEPGLRYLCARAPVTKQCD